MLLLRAQSNLLLLAHFGLRHIFGEFPHSEGRLRQLHLVFLILDLRKVHHDDIDQFVTSTLKCCHSVLDSIAHVDSELPHLLDGEFLNHLERLLHEHVLQSAEM